MNRTHRRALARAQRHPITRESLSSAKRWRRIPAQVCALWVPDAHGYVEYFSPHGFRVIELAELARHYDEDEACSAALAFREVTGLRVAIRPVYLQKVAA
jgi:hypothetical protein